MIGLDEGDIVDPMRMRLDLLSDGGRLGGGEFRVEVGDACMGEIEVQIPGADDAVSTARVSAGTVNTDTGWGRKEALREAYKMEFWESTASPFTPNRCPPF